VEKQAIADCMIAMKSGETLLKTYSAFSQDVVDKGMVCGNNMTIFIEPGERLPYLYLCGCGHVAQAVLPLAKAMGYYVVAIDARDISGYEEVLRPADELHILDSFDKIGQIDFVPGAAFIVCSFSHKTDGDILNTGLSKEPSYVGMLGGKPKIKALFSKLKENGYEEEILKQIHAPIGLDIGGERPAEIAVSIMAEVQAAKYGGSCRPMRDILHDSVFPL
jgi:xanthine dehydrogenase accessory factor